MIYRVSNEQKYKIVLAFSDTANANPFILFLILVIIIIIFCSNALYHKTNTKCI